MTIGDKEFAEANDQGREMLRTPLHATAASYDAARDRVTILLNTGIEISFAPADAQGLEAATPADLAEIEIMGSGFGIHFPKLDADLYLPALLDEFFGSKAWAAARLAQEGGKAQTEGGPGQRQAWRPTEARSLTVERSPQHPGDSPEQCPDSLQPVLDRLRSALEHTLVQSTKQLETIADLRERAARAEGQVAELHTALADLAVRLDRATDELGAARLPWFDRLIMALRR